MKKLSLSQKPEILEVLKPAFAEHPMLPPGTPIETTQKMLELVIDSFGSTDKAYFYGIEKDGKLACVSFSTDSRCEPKGLAMLIFFFKLLRLLGWKLGKDFLKAISKRPKYKDPYFDLTLLGTLPEYHGQGLGKVMLRYLFDVAKEEGYKGVILSVAKETPAYQFYLKEGFVLDKEIPLGPMPLCHVRRENRY